MVFVPVRDWSELGLGLDLVESEEGRTVGSFKSAGSICGQDKGQEGSLKKLCHYRRRG